MPADVSNEDDVRRLVDRAEARSFPQIHVLVNNAGVYGPMGAIEDVDWSDWVQRDRDQSLLGSVLPCRALAAALPAACATARSSSFPAAAPRILLPRRQRLRGVEGRDRALRRDARGRSARPPASTSTRSRRARSTRACSTRCWRPGPSASGEASTSGRSKTEAGRCTPLSVGAELAVFLGSARERRHHRQAASAPSGIRGGTLPAHRADLDRERHLHAAAHRAQGSRTCRGADAS